MSYPILTIGHSNQSLEEFLHLLKLHRVDVLVDVRSHPFSKYTVQFNAPALKDAIAAGADAFVTADFKYHEFFDADGKLIIADIGHFESEQFTSNMLIDIIQEKFPNFAIRLTEHNTNPINYFI